MNRKFRISISAFLALGIVAANAQEPIDQENLVEQLRYAQTRYAALNEIRAMPSESVGAAIRGQLIAELSRTNALIGQAASGSFALEDVESPAYVTELHRVVAALKHSDTIPALANALGLGTVIGQLVDMGDQAAPAVLDVVTDSAKHYTAVDDGLRVLRMMVENAMSQPLSNDTVSRIRAAVEQRLTGPQYFTTVSYAIDLASVLDDRNLEQRLELISTYSTEVMVLGIEDPRIIEKIQQRAADRLAGVPARPRREDMPR